MKGRLRDYAIGFSLFIAFCTGRVPSHAFRLFVYRRILRMTIGRDSTVHWRLVMYAPHGITIGRNSIIGNDCFFDGRWLITIGDNVNFGDHVHIYTGQHDPQSTDFGNKTAPVVIGDRAYVGPRVMILYGTTIGEGAVIGAGAVVTKDVAPYSIVAGIPARPIGERRRDLDYTLKYHLPFQ